MNLKRTTLIAWCVALRLSPISLLSLGLAPELRAQTTSRVSLGSGGIQGNDVSYPCRISHDGRLVVFVSDASNLVPGDTNGVGDVFVRDRQTGITTRVNLSSSGSQADGWDSGAGLITPDGRYVTFTTRASNLVPGDTNGMTDVFVHDRQTGQTTRVSVSSSATEGDNVSYGGPISADGRYVAFDSFATNLVPGDTNGTWDVFLHDRQTATTTRVSLGQAGAQASGEAPSISADGRFLAFFSTASNVVPNDTNGVADLFVRDLIAGTTERISVATGGGQSNGFSTNPVVSADGRYVVFESDATNLVTPDANGTEADIFVRDRVAGTTERVSVSSTGIQASSPSELAWISADGRYVTFSTHSINLVPGDTNGAPDVFLHDRQTGFTTRVSVTPSGSQMFSASHSSAQAVSANGPLVAFWSGNPFVPEDTNGGTDCFVRDLGPTFTSFCPGDGTGAPCPCGNSGLPGHGCENSGATGGALLGYSGTPLPTDTVVLDVTGERASALTIFVQGNVPIAPVAFGDGLRCLGGALKRLYVKSAVNGHATAPLPTDPSIKARSATLGDPIPPGATRYYMTQYRDGAPGFCPNPGSSFNSSNGLAVVW